MPAQILAQLDAQVTAAVTVMTSATLLIKGIGTRVQTAIDAALRNGATEAELAPVQAEVDALAASSNDLASAVSENTPAANLPA